MASYWGLGTPQNRGLWVLFVCCFIAGAVMLPLGWAKVTPCIQDYNNCRNTLGGSLEPICRAQRDDCGRYWARVWVAGVILLVAASVPLCIFACCSKRPEAYYGNSVPMATAMQPYPQGAYQQFQPSAYPPPPGGVYTAMPVEGQPVMYTAVPVQPNGQPVVYGTVPPNGQPAAYYYPPPPAGGAYAYPPPPAPGGANAYPPPAQGAIGYPPPVQSGRAPHT